VLLAALAVGVLSVAGCAGQSARTTGPVARGSADLAQAKAQLLVGDAAAARAALEASLAKRPTAEGYYYLALVQSLEGPSGTRTALQTVNRSILAKPMPQALLLKGILLDKTDAEGAVAAYREGIERAEPGGLTAALLHRNLGLLLGQSGDWNAGRTAFGKYVAWADEHRRGLSDSERAVWGVMLYRQGQESDAAETWSGIRDESLRSRLLDAAKTVPAGTARVAQTR
jgi:hypothetical protein